MSKSSVALAALLMAGLTLPISRLAAQTHIGDVETGTGDVWPSREPYIYVPREALELPNLDLPGDLEVATGDVWPSGQKTPASQGLVPPIVGDQGHRQMTR
jgi:hypothetical protein